MSLKYHDMIKDLPDCPPITGKNITTDSYRFVFNDINHKNNFLPALIITPKRINSKIFSEDRMKCSGYALSLFNKLENAIKRYVKLQKSVRNIKKTIGDHIASGLIDKSDGYVTEPNKHGHFDLHEFDDVHLKNKFSVIYDLSGD